MGAPKSHLGYPMKGGFIMKPSRKNPIIVVRPITDAQKAKETAAAIRCRQILSGTAALHRYIRKVEEVEAVGWSWK